jgi:hypothetical protein
VQPHTVEIVDALGGLAFTVAGFEVTRRMVFFSFIGIYMILIFSAHRWRGGAFARRVVQEQTQVQYLVVNKTYIKRLFCEYFFSAEVNYLCLR